jgi:hypothetical protein
METETASSLFYPCPHCRAMIVMGQDRWRGWVRCPECGRPGLPPDHALRPRASRRRIEDPPAPRTEELAAPHPRPSPHPDGLAGPIAPVPVRVTPAVPRHSPSSASRVIVSTGFIVSIFLLLVAYLDRSSQSSAIFGCLTLLFFLLLLRVPRRG